MTHLSHPRHSAHKYAAKRTLLFFISLFFISQTTLTYGQEWPENLRRNQAEFELDKSELPEKEEDDDLDIRRGQISNVANVEAPTVMNVTKRDIINPFDTQQISETPAMQMLPEDITVPDLPDPEIQQQINLDEFRNYLNTLVESPLQTIREDLSTNQITKELNKINITALMTSPAPYVKIDGNKFKIGDSFSIEVTMPKRRRNMERIMADQMPDKDTVSDEVYQEFEAIKRDALNRYRTKESQRQVEINADDQKLMVLVSDIQHRKLVLSVQGENYIIPIKLSL